MNTFELTFTGGEALTVPGGNYLEILEASGPVDVQLLRKGSPVEKAEGAKEGYYTERPAVRVPWLDDTAEWFTSARITSATAQTVQVGVTLGRGGSKRSRGSVSVDPSSGLAGASDVPVADDSAEHEVIAANSSRRVLWIVNTSTTDAVRLGGTGSVDAATGIYLQSGQSIELKTTAAVYAWAPTGPVTLAIAEET